MYAACLLSELGLASALSSRKLPCCRGWAWITGPASGTIVGWLVPMVRSRVRARARAEWCYRLLSCPGSAAAEVAAVSVAAAATAAAGRAAVVQQQQH